MFDTQIDTFRNAFSFLPSDLLAYLVGLCAFMFITAIVRIFWR